MEIWAPEAVVVLFLVLPLCRPFVKALWSLDGLNWLPFVGLGIIAGINFAYGFRPECLPLLVYTIGFITVNILFRLQNTLHRRNHLGTTYVFIMLGAAVVIMFAFSPKVDIKQKTNTEDITMVPIQGTYGKDYTLRVYGNVEASRPLIFIVPPEFGTAASIDLVCTELKEKGYTVVTYFHSARQQILAKPLTYWRMTKKAASLVSMPFYI